MGRARRNRAIAQLARRAAAVVAVCAFAGACTDRVESASSSGLAHAPSTPEPAPTSAPVRTPASTLPARPAASPWKIAFDDEFNGTTLDPHRWATCYYWSATTCTNTNTHELELYTPHGVSVAAGALHLTARREAAVHDGSSFAYTSGMVSGATPDHTLFSLRYGYIETRARVPAGSGFWSAFWLLPRARAALPEIDVFEIVGYRPDVALQFAHWDASDGAHQFGNATKLAAVGGGWHVYALDWEPTALTWFVDGREVWTLDDPAAVPREAMMLVADLAVGGSYATEPRASTPFPSTLSFDYVRVWQHR